ncbi:hypothetical protein B0H34DRAFT_460630 [Crassisporium funariophilum]|nr:hypothetical protein B0H34DRAFT_460630 [Crassisporium funariophilum]
MMSLRPPSTSPSPSPGPYENGKAHARQSMGPSARGTPTLAPASPRPGGMSSARPTSELLGTGAMFQTPEAEALDQWFENLQNYEATLEDMAAASLDVNFKEELSAIEQWFKVLSEAERTAALYSLLQHSTQVQIRFFITVLQQMARSDPMTALLSPAMGGSMQSQMEAKLASIKSPGLKSGLPASPTTRNFNAGNRQSLALDNSSNYLSPDSAAILTSQNDAAAATLAQQRAKLKASNAAHRISAPVLNSAGGDGRASWAASTQLSQVSEQQSNAAQEVTVNVSRPKSTEFSGTIGSPRANNEATTTVSDSWASMVNTPLIPMFKKETRPAPQPAMDVAPSRGDWQNSSGPGVPRMGDPTIHRRNQKQQDGRNNNNNNNDHNGGGVYDDNGNPIHAGQQNQQGRGASGGMRNVSGGNAGGGWNGRSPGQLNNNNAPPNRFGGGGDDNGVNGLTMQMNNFGMGMGSPTLGMGMPGLGVGGMQPMSPFNMLSMMNMSPEAQLLAAQMAASGFGQPNWLGMQPMSAGLGPGGQLGNRGRGGPSSARSPGIKSASSTGSRMDGGMGGNSTPKGEEDVDPTLLTDIPGWLRSLRLHKYTPNFENARWQDMVMMDEAALEAKGVAALGARRKMLKTFELVRKKMGIDGGPPSSLPPSATLKSP